MTNQVYTEAEQKKRRQQKKSKKGKKEFTNGPAVYKYFNVATVPTEQLEAFVNNMLGRATDVLQKHDIVMEPWHAFGNLAKNTIDAWTGTDTIGEKYWWMDQYVDAIGTMIWCDVFRKYHSEWYKTGVLIEVPELPKKLRKSGECVAEHFADTSVARFTEPFK